MGVVQAPVGGEVWHAVRGELAYRRDGHRDTVLRARAPATAPRAGRRIDAIREWW